MRLALCLVCLALSACLRPWPAPAPVAPEAQGAASVAVVEGGGEATVSGSVTVAVGDTLYAIARRRDVAIRSLIEANRLVPPYTLVPGQRLAVPSLPEYRVAEGDTLYRISRCTGVDMAVLSRLNGIVPPYVISHGQRLRVPPPTRAPECPERGQIVTVAAVPVPPPPPPVETTEAVLVATPIPPPTPGPPPEPPARSGGRFLRPVEGPLLAAYGRQASGRQNDGINVAAPAGTPVRATENGVVVYAGNELRGYGNLLLVRHAEGWTSAYAHNSRLLVGRGATVARGQVIAEVGQSGNVTRPQSHFELRRGAEAVDPQKHLAGE
jgi:murein DD-endopeptidase MepM/ murein hydrolase activator NlpD